MPIRHAIADIRMMNELLPAAEREAQSMGDEQPAAEHLLLAALKVEDDSALNALGHTVDEFRASIEAVHAKALATVGIAAGTPLPPGGPPSPAPRMYRSSGSAQDLFQGARKLAGQGPLRSAHLLLAALAVEQGTVARALEHLGIDRKEIESAAVALISSKGKG